MRRLLLTVLLSTCAACGGGAKTLELTLTMPDGAVQRRSFESRTGFRFDGTSLATASFPDIATWTKDVPLGVSVDVGALQPGRYTSSGFLHLGDDTVATARAVGWEVNVERVRWQNDGAFPFRLEGTLTGRTAENHQLEGRFSTTTPDCSDKVLANSGSWLCGLPYPSTNYREQKWSIDGWVKAGDCPDAVFTLFAGGSDYTVGPRSAAAGGQRSLQCVGTYANEYRAICGASVEGLEADGCTWSVTAYSTPGAVSLVQPRMAVFAGTTGSSCAPKLCTIYPASFTHVSGATAQD